MISVVMLVKNGESHIKEVLDSLRGFDEVICYDTGSTDGTIAIVSSYPNTKIHHGTMEGGFGITRNRAASFAKHSFILQVDADEVLSKELQEELLSLQLDSQVVYTLPIKNFYNGKWIRGCGWYPNRVKRLYSKEFTCFSDLAVHEGVIVKGPLVDLKGHLHHYSYNNVHDFLRKMQHYSDLFAEQYAGKKKSSLGKALFRGFAAFFRTYFLRYGFIDGKEGLIISLYNAHTTYYKYLKLAEKASVPRCACGQKRRGECGALQQLPTDNQKEL